VPRIVISGWYGQRNVGDEAMLEVLLAELSRAAPDADFCILSERPEEIVEHYGERYSVEALPHPSPYGWKRMLDGSRRHATGDVWRAVRESQLFVLGGGSLIRDHNKSNFTRVMDELHIAQGAGVPTAVIGVKVGPLRTGWGRFWSKRLLACANVVSVRDEASERTLDELGVVGVESTGDLTLLLEAGPFTTDGPAPICFAPCEAMRRGIPDGPPGNPDLARLLGESASALNQATGAPIELVPFRSGVPEEDDARVCEEVRAAMVDPAAATIAPFDLDPHIVKGRLARARLVVGARLHSLVFAAHTGVPIIGIGYGPKIRRFLAALDLEEFCIEPADVTPALVMDLERRWDAERAGAMRDSMREMEDGVRSEVARVVALLR